MSLDGRTDERCAGGGRLKRLFKQAFAAALLLGAISFLIQPRVSTVVWGGIILFLLTLLGLAASRAEKAKRLSVRVPPKTVLRAIFVFTCVFCLVVPELLMRCFFAPPFYQREDVHTAAYLHEPELGWFPEASSRHLYVTSRAYAVTNNSKGFRDTEPVKSARPTIAFIGDSFVWGFDAEAQERFTDLLQAKHPEWNIRNLGVIGYGTDQELLLLERCFNDYKPALVFLVFCAENDSKENCSNVRPGGYYKPYFTTNADGGLTINGVPVPRSDRLFVVNHPILCWPYLMQWAVHAWFRASMPAEFHNPHDPTEELLKAMHQLVSTNGASFVVGLTSDCPPVQTFLKSSGIACLDLSTTNRYPDNGFHWTPRGHQLVAEQIEQFLTSRDAWRQH
jgi:lysophospholipase L1-like esterase